MHAADPPGHKTPLLAMSGILAAHVFLFTPVVLFEGNAAEFASPLLELLRFWLIPGLAVFLLALLPGKLLPRPARERYTPLLAVLGMLCWLQATVLVWNYGVLDGRPIDWAEGQWRGWLDAAIWILAIAGALRLGAAKRVHLYRAAVLIFLVHLLAIGHAAWRTGDRLAEPGYVAPPGAMEQAAQFSKQTNVLHLLLDGFQADIFEDLMTDPRVGQSNREAFDGFVFYNETLSAFIYTQFSVPSFLSGRFYDNSMSKDDFLDEVFTGKTILNTAVERGFEVDLLVGDTYLSNRMAHGRFTNLINIDALKGAGPRAEAARLAELSLFRSAPHFLKPFIYNEQQWLISARLADKEHGGLSFFRHTEFMHEFIGTASVAREPSVYKYLHIMNTHRPMVVDSRCQYAGRVLPDSRDNLTAQARCTLDTVVGLFQRLKELGIYDDMLIVMHADHGGWAPTHRRGNPIRVASGQLAPPVVMSLASPLLAIKLPGSSGALRTLPTLASLMDLPDTIGDVLGWDVAFGHRSLLDIEPGEIRKRRHYFFEWVPGEWDEAYALPIQEFVIEGSHYDTPWRAGTVYEAPANTRERRMPAAGPPG